MNRTAATGSLQAEVMTVTVDDMLPAASAHAV